MRFRIATVVLMLMAPAGLSAHPIEIGSTVQPELTRVGEVSTESWGWSDAKLPNGPFCDSWTTPVPEGSPVTIDPASDDFDAHLTLMAPRGEPIGQDENGAGGCDARITVTFPQTQTHRAIFTMSRENAIGAYRASLLANPEPLALGTCELDRQAR